jgi:hypothetical protein
MWKENDMKEATTIQNYDSYISRMNRSMLDKLFFLDKVDADIFVDFGSADGELIYQMEHILSNENKPHTFIGYDVDGEMVKRGNERFSGNKNVTFTSDWDVVRERLSGAGKKAIILSSIIHEIYHYLDVTGVDDFWTKVYESGFDYIIIRDMIPSRSVERDSDVNDVVKVYRKFFNTKPLMDFEAIWGRIENNKNLIHFLLKYKYVEPNWNREVKENYLPLYKENLLSTIPSEYDVRYIEHFTLPYIKDTVKADLGIEIRDNTHLKLILELNN